MDIDKLHEGNRILKEIDDHIAKINKLSSTVYLAREERPRFKRFAQLFKRSSDRDKHYDETEGVWYWAYTVEPERLVELNVDDMEVMLEGYRNRIELLEKEFEEL